MSQNSQRLSWTFEEVDAKLKDIMVGIFAKVDDASSRYNMKGATTFAPNCCAFSVA